QTSYGPAHIIQHSSSNQTSQTGSDATALGIPGALSNEPPGQTTAAPPTPTPVQAAGKNNPGAKAPQTAAAAPQPPPSRTTDDLDQTFVTDQTDSDITKPGWTIKSIAVSVVLNQAALPKNLQIQQIKTAIASAFAYPNVAVNVLATPFQKQATPMVAEPIIAAANPLAHAMLEVLAATALLFGLALPAGRRIANVNLKTMLPAPQPMQRPLPVITPPRDFSELRDQASENIPGVARLLQSWTEENE
ncbi:MAG: hypothetical protein KGK02_09455, partial [Rhodospirillales bacterium]|nr:hypothetical protein [Rhodospirillales bacterium]